MRVTDERLVEILATPDIIGETELESLAREVSELRDQVEQLTRERDADRELLRRFRNETRPSGRDKLIDEYDARFGQQPEPTVELVPWNAETRPRGVVFLRNHEYPGRERIAQTWNEGHVSAAGHGWVGFSDLFSQWEWSRDGITWQRCGVRT